MTNTQNRDEAQKPETGNSQRVFLSIGKKLFFTALLIFLLIPIFEICGRLCGYPKGAMRSFSKIRIRSSQTFDRVPGVFRPGYSGRVLWPEELAYNIKINELGMRGREVKRARSPGVYRILCVGDSNTFCLYSNEEYTWPELLRGHFEKDGLKTELLNSGCPGWSTADQARFLAEKALDKVKPDMVLHMFCGNDPYDIKDVEAQQGKYARLARRVKKYNAFTGLQEWLTINTALGEFTSRVRIALKGVGQETRLGAGQGPGAKPLPLPVPQQAYEKYQQCYGKMARLCASRKIPLLSFCFPHHKSDIEGSQDMLGLEKQVGQTAVKSGAGFLYIIREFEQHSEPDRLFNLPYDYHLNEKGNQFIAELLWKRFQSQKLGPYSK
jgi:hypothetical protein